MCCAALIYWLLAAKLADMLKVPGPADKKEEDYPALKRKKVSTVRPGFSHPLFQSRMALLKPQKPGIGMAYLYEPVGNDVAPMLNVPIRAPANRLMTTHDSRYVS